ncbi:MAG TPA: transcriptional regulator [Candidatus Synoicihabitans sp.]|nr:transcriptional regulator [Candidatus Synoicihabitans sp.]
MNELNELIHQPVRLRIMAALSALGPREQVDFMFLKENLGLTDGNLGAHLRALEEAGYVASEKTFVARRPKTFLAATALGRKAFTAHVAALTAILKPR